MRIKKSSKYFLGVAVSLLLVSSNAFALDYPTKPINVIVASGVGGSIDLIARVIPDKMSEKLGVPVIVLDKPGSGGTIGADFVAKSKPDGYNILVFMPAHILRQTIDPKIPFNVLKDFEPICMYAYQPLVLVVKGDSKYKTIEDLIDAAKKNPGKLAFGHSGVGTTSHFSIELFKIATKTDVKHVPFQGDAQSTTALMGGHIDAVPSAMAPIISKVRSGDLRVLACLEETRPSEWPDIPTFKEKGYPEAVMYSWTGFAAPAGTPKEIVEKLDAAIRAAIKDPASQTGIKNLVFKDAYKGPSEFKQFIRSELEKFDRIAKEGGITVQ